MNSSTNVKAIDVVKQMVADGQVSQDVAEKYFPELKESEDERIRKELIAIYSVGAKVNAKTGDILDRDIVAWLEKQGEQGNNEDEAILHRFSFYSYKDEPNILYLAGLYVNDEYRNKGIGTKILKIADEVAVSMKCSSILLKTEIGSNAERLYKNNGYSVFRREENQVWLEKQCEQKPVDKIQLGKKYKCIASPRYSAFMKGEIYKPEDKFLCNLMNFCSDCFEPIEDGEQKHTDKVEPKFHKGDWVVCKNGSHRVFQVIERSWPNAKYLDEKGFGGFLNVFTLDKQYRPWTIQDAKNGDILYSRHNTESFEWIGIFKSLDKENKRVFFYGFWHDMAESFSVCGYEAYVLYDDFSPATKEQRDLLFSKMKEADYEWDANKKELKKIEQKPAEWSEDDETVLNNLIYALANDRIGNNRDEYVNWLKSLKDRVQPKQELSKEDEAHIDSLLKRLEGICKPGAAFISTRFAISQDKDWLKSLKGRVGCEANCTTTKEWSEEDEKKISDILAILRGGENCYYNSPTLIDWLKSIRPQKRWKPSNEQIMCLQDVIDDYHRRGYKAETLGTLLKQLKQL